MKKINISPPRQLVKLAVAVLALGVGLLVSNTAQAVSSLNYTADTTVHLATQNIDLVIQNGSGANSVIVDVNTLTVTVPAGSTFVVRNTDKRTLSNDQSIATNCTGSYSELSMGAPSGTVTVVITPASSGTCTVTPPSGGGGGGGGGGPTVTSTATALSNMSVVIAGGAAQATSTGVTLTLAATGATQMAISNSVDFSNVSFETYATSKAWTLLTGDGVKTVYVKYRDASGNVSAAVSDSITLNTTGTPVTITPPATTPAATPAPATSEERAKQIETIVDEAGDVSAQSAEALAAKVGKGRDTGLEQRYESTIVARVVVASTPAATKAQVLNFVTYGTPTTTILGAGERAGVVNSFRAAFGKVPTAESDWADVIKIANGRFPGTLNAEREKAMDATFKKIYLRSANRASANDDAAITVMAYGLRTATRNLTSEKAAINSFKAIYGKAPTSASDWDAVRAIAYSGAKR
ncbi:MAG: hypothetical protein HY974_03050 [Candidatus Kerfeldbacteria bacterium]|nr:hypothetical protein [Candidatus Kerfeldbacteria bacterium]